MTARPTAVFCSSSAAGGLPCNTFASDHILCASRFVAGTADLRGGWMWRSGETVPLVGVESHTDYEEDGLTPRAVVLEVAEADGATTSAVGEVLAAVPVPMEGG